MENHPFENVSPHTFLVFMGNPLFELTFFEAGSKMKNCVSTAPARADRGSDPPEKLKKTLKNDLRINTPTNPILLQKVHQKITPKSMKMSPLGFL